VLVGRGHPALRPTHPQDTDQVPFERDPMLPAGGIIRRDPRARLLPAPLDDVLIDDRLPRIGSEPLVDADSIPAG